MQLSQETLTVVALGAAGIALVCLAVAGVLGGRLARLRASYEILQGGGTREDFVTAVDRHVRAAEELRAEVRALRGDVAAFGHALERAIQRVGVVRYDAFDDMGGHLSFSAALLDAGGDGLVITTINGRTDSRIYAKPIQEGGSRYNLSEEEQEAIRRALAGVPR